MKICLLYSGRDVPATKKRGFLCGLLSYVVRGDSLYTAKKLPFETADILAISADDISLTVAHAIYNEAKSRNAHGVFLDTFSHFPREAFGTLAVFAPSKNGPTNRTIPVIETALTGGSLTEHIGNAPSQFAVSIRRTAQGFSLPAENAFGSTLSFSDLRSLISRYSPDVFFSPELYRKYFIYEDSQRKVNLVLFDDAETISHKLRLAKKHGASHAFLVWNEVSDIFDEIFF